MPGLFILACLVCASTQVQSYVHSDIASVRFAHFEVLCHQYTTSAKSIKEQHVAISASEDKAAQLAYDFALKFFALARENPTDETAFHCCTWVIAHCGKRGADRAMYEAEADAWDMLAKNQACPSPLMVTLCLKAANYPTPAREEFLRALPDNYRLPVEVHGAAYLGLAELLAKRYEIATSTEDFSDGIVAELADYLAIDNADQLRAESNDLFQHVLENYAEVPLTLTGAKSSQFKTLGERAARHRGLLKVAEQGHETVRTGFDRLTGS